MGTFTMWQITHVASSVRTAIWLTSSSFCFSLLASGSATAGGLVGGPPHTVNNGDNEESWQLSQNATLNINQARTFDISAQQSQVNATGARTQQISAGAGSDVRLAGTTVSGGNARAGLELLNSTATISGNSIISSNRLGLQAARNTSTSTGSSATVSDSIITGVTGGARATAFSNLTFSNSSITGTGAASSGVSLLSGTASASNNTQISGGQNGVTLGLEGAGLPASQLHLDRSSVEGQSGSAIVVDYADLSAPASSIDVSNGSTLKGGNGTVLEVRRAGNVSMNVDRSDLTGNVLVSDSSVAALSFSQGSLTGDVKADTGATASVALAQGSQLTGAMAGVASSTIDSSSRWNMTDNSQVGNLILNGGTVKIGTDSAFHQLDVQNLSGNGVFEMNVNFATNQADTLNVTGTATGNHQLLVNSSGAEPASGQPVQLVRTAQGDASFSLANVNGEVDRGAFVYGLKQSDSGHDWFLDPTARNVSPSTRAVTALFNTAITVLDGEAMSLRSRMGEVRFNQDKSGAWGRVYGSKINVSDAFGDGYQQSQQGFTLGADAPLRLGAGQWLLGVMAGRSTSNLDLHRGTSGTITSSYIGSYLTFIDETSGYYVDSVVKLNHFQNEAKVGMTDGSRSKGDYDNNGISGSVEAGRHIKLDRGYFLEPFILGSAAVIKGKDYGLDNGLSVKGDRTRSLRGKVGVTAGRDVKLINGATVQPYVRLALAHEFSKNNEVKVNNNVFNNDLSGSRGELGGGVAYNLSERWQAHVELEYMSGKNIEMPLGGTVGVQYKW
ncbi:UNVERIFIED_ORG: outer membrane autotransporter protein [Pseudomonas fluorescens]|uniref:autotransporter outer membrane beta-barrel domain-containing protein n=1 Tax=Pseudomonas TaxID=286 RepID=UPI00117BB5B7|nr:MULTISPECIES: autotransporter outer membrane beta-barrel domain-containing protein [unclassified Pseudomonas]MDP9708877.1 outer membrane autotransporter protein [Pseudomonas fluorescens]